MPEPHKRMPSNTVVNSESPAPVVVPFDVRDDADPLASFEPEGEARRRFPPPVTSRPARPLPARRKVIGGVAVAVLAIGVLGAWYLKTRVTVSAATPAAPLTGRALLNSRPAGAAVLIDGVARGITPLEVELPVGEHSALLRTPTGERTITLKVDSGVRVVEDVDLPVAESSAQLEVTSEPAGARVLLDGKPAGQTPVKLHDVAAGRHVVAVAQGSTSINRNVDVAAGATASVFVSLPAGGSAVQGSVVVEAPVELRLLENGELLGVSNAVPLGLAAGKHQFELVNDALELRLTRTVTIDAGRTTRVTVPVPNGTMYVNASPWSDVFVDGKNIGQTPLGNVSIAVGTHEVVWRHPQLGERRRTVTIGARTPVHVAVDMTK